MLIIDGANIADAAEFQTSLIYDDCPATAVENSFRLNVTYTMPMGN